MKTMHLLIAGLLAAVMVSACFGTSVEEQAARLGVKEFTTQRWVDANQDERAEMVASLLAKHKFKGRPAREVQALLGQPTGYLDYDEDPAYLVGPESVKSIYAKGYLLVLVTDKSSGHVAEVRIVPQVEKLDLNAAGGW